MAEARCSVSEFRAAVGDNVLRPEASASRGSLAIVLANEFPESFRWLQEVTASARKCIRLEYTAPDHVDAQVQRVFGDLQELKKRLLYENFYFRIMEMELETTAEVLELAKTSADWRIVLFFSFLDPELPQFEQEFDYALNLLAANSTAIADGTSKLGYSFEAVIASMAA